MLLPLKTLQHVLTALAATPLLLNKLAVVREENDPAWDVRLPDRFTPREHVAHLADWEDVFQGRILQTLGEPGSTLQNPDPDEFAAGRGYGILSPLGEAARFSQRRDRLLRLLEGLVEPQWQVSALHPNHGPMTIEAQAVHILGHDGYHLGFLAKML